MTKFFKNIQEMNTFNIAVLEAVAFIFICFLRY